MLQRPGLHRHDRDRAADREAGLGRLPGLGRRPAARRRGAPRADRAAPLPPRPARRGDQLGADRRRRLRGARSRGRARPLGAQPGRREPLPRPLRERRPASSTRPASQHAYNLAQEFRAAGIKAEAVSGKTPPVKLAETLAAYERGEINVLINAQLLAEGWNSPRATVCFHLAPTASRRVYQQRIGRIMRMHPRKEAGIVVDFVPKGSTHNDRVVSLHSLLDADFYREGARVTPGPAAPPAAPGAPQALSGTVARAGDARRRAPARRDPARVAARRPEVPRRRRAALLGDDRRPPDPLRPARRASRGSSPRAVPARGRWRRSSRSAPPRTRTGVCA